MKTQTLLWRLKQSRRAQLSIVIAFLLIVVGGTGYFVFRDSASPLFTGDDVAAEDTGRTVARAIDGVQVPLERANRFPVAVVIDNATTAKPQIGINKAGVVYETVAEGGITRWLAVFASGEEIEKIGPVRSARPYFVTLAQEYGALFSHVGGSPTALNDVATHGVFDLDQFFNAPYYWRDTERFAPHNLYTSSNFLALALRDKEAAATGSFRPWQFKKERPTESGTQEISIEISSFSYLIGFTYDAAKNDYVRFQGGEEDLLENGDQIRPKNIITQNVAVTQEDASRLSISLVDEGDGYLFTDGQTHEIEWKKDSRDARTRYYFSDGREVQLNPGLTWVVLVPEGRPVIVN